MPAELITKKGLRVAAKATSHVFFLCVKGGDNVMGVVRWQVHGELCLLVGLSEAMILLCFFFACVGRIRRTTQTTKELLVGGFNPSEKY